MGVFVLVHGAWHGGWCWRKVASLLRAQGHEVFAPTLTGLGERKHLLPAFVDLNTHIEDITNVLFYEDLNQVILVGHSYAGVVIPGVADRVPDRVHHLVYLDASILKDGQSMSDILPTEMREAADLAIRRDEHLRRPPSGEDLGVSSRADLDWLAPRLVPDPTLGPGALTTKVSLCNPKALKIPKTFINCTMSPDDEHRRSFILRGFLYEEIATGHDAMVSAPQEVAQLLIACLH